MGNFSDSCPMHFLKSNAFFKYPLKHVIWFCQSSSVHKYIDMNLLTYIVLTLIDQIVILSL